LYEFFTELVSFGKVPDLRKAHNLERSALLTNSAQFGKKPDLRKAHKLKKKQLNFEREPSFKIASNMTMLYY
jgi:hypothetical protein